MRLPRERFDYSPITSRRPWKLPKGARIAVWTIVNIEEWDFEKGMARQYLTAPQGVTGKKPRGWLGPGLSETWETLDLLAEEGIEYVSDWVNDDQPYEIRTTAGPLVSVPYTLELNDIPMMVIQHHSSGEWLQRAKDQFDRLYAEGARNPRVMALAVHPYISGVPHRIKYFEAVYDYMRKKKGVWFTTGEDIYEWYKSQR